jgi:hypothetical protein
MNFNHWGAGKVRDTKSMHDAWEAGHQFSAKMVNCKDDNGHNKCK